jgi:hypothetical protein
VGFEGVIAERTGEVVGLNVAKSSNAFIELFVDVDLTGVLFLTPRTLEVEFK